jgi:hypothetical protein
MSAPTLPARPIAARPFKLALDGTAARLRALAPWLLIAAVALASRLRYGVFGFHETFGSGDAHLILAKAWFISHGQFEPPAALGPSSEVFIDPPLIPLTFAALSKIGLPIDVAPLIVTPAISIAGLLALYAIARRAFDAQIALPGVLLVALLPRFALDSTEPDKVAYVVSLFLIALMLLYVAHASRGRARALAFGGAGVFMGLSLFAHNTAWLFVPVFVLAHPALARFRIRALLDRWVVASLVIPLLFFAAFVAIESSFQTERYVPVVATAAAPASSETPPVAFPAPEKERRIVPAQFETYWNTLSGLARGGFRGSAWNQYFDAIRAQVSSPVYALAIAGFAIGCWYVVVRRRYELIPLLAWMAVVTLGFAIQHPAASHRTRYPSYVTPAFALFATAAVVWLARAVAMRAPAENRASWAMIIALPLLVFVAASYVMHEGDGLRRLYAPHREAAEYLTSNDLLSDDSQVLYIGWPSITYYVLDDEPEAEPWLHAFGWGRVDLRLFTPAYLQANHVRYFVHDPRGADYFNSSGQMLTKLERNYDLREVARLCGEDGKATCDSVYITIYEIIPKQPQGAG